MDTCHWEGSLAALTLDLPASAHVATIDVGPTRGTVQVDEAGTHVVLGLSGLTLVGDTRDAVLRLREDADWPGIHADAGAAVRVQASPRGLVVSPALPEGFTALAAPTVGLGCAAVGLDVPRRGPAEPFPPDFALRAGAHALFAHPDGPMLGLFDCPTPRRCAPVIVGARFYGWAHVTAIGDGTSVEGWLRADAVSPDPGNHLWSLALQRALSPTWTVSCAETPAERQLPSGERVPAGHAAGEVVVGLGADGLYAANPALRVPLLLPYAARDCHPR